MNIYELPVHPAADVFPMLDIDELADLAADIKSTGLQHPIVVGTVDGVEMLIDGRNRLAACKMAGIEPEIKQLNGTDPVSLILSENVHRRHMTTGQKAMSTAEVLGFGYGKLSSDIFTSNFKAKISHARLVIKFAPEHIETIKSGAIQLATAYEEAKQRKNAGNDDTDKLAWLKGEAPDLADRVIEGGENGLTLPGAIAEHHERERVAKVNREAALRNMRDGIYGFGTFFLNEDRINQAINLATEYRDEFETICAKDSSEALRYLKAMDKNIVKLIKGMEK
jgi:hypothetical protein